MNLRSIKYRYRHMKTIRFSGLCHKPPMYLYNFTLQKICLFKLVKTADLKDNII